MKLINKVIPAIFFCSVGVGAAERYIDPVQNAVDIQHKKMIPELMKTCSAKNTGACKDEARMKAEESVPSRGTKPYCQQAYGKMTREQKKQKLRDLVELYDELDGQSKAARWPGKITQFDVDYEISWILGAMGERSGDITAARLYLGLPI